MLSMKMHLIRRPWDLSISHFSLLRSADLSSTVLYARLCASTKGRDAKGLMISMNLPAIWWGLTHQGKKKH